MTRSLCALILLLLDARFAAAQRVAPGASTVTFDRRPIAVWAPSAVRGKTPVPLLLLLHGAGGKGEDYLRFVRQFIGRRQWLVAAPTAQQGANGTWQIADAAWFGRLIDHLAQRAPVDRRRVYLAGHSAGCAFAFYVTGELPLRFAGVAGTAGYFPPGCNEAGLRKARQTRIWFGVGRRDPNHAHFARGVAELRALGLQVTTDEPDFGHTTDAAQTGRWLSFLDRQKLPDSKPPEVKQPAKQKQSWLELETLAARRLAAAKKLLEAGRRDEARAALRRIVIEFRGTGAAEEAGKLLGQER